MPALDLDDLHRSLAGAAAASSMNGIVDVRDEQRTLTSTFGTVGDPTDTPISASTGFATASAAKGVTALVIAAMVADGRLTFDDRVAPILGDRLPHLHGDLTLRHLLGHRSGVGDYFPEDEEDDPEVVDLGVPQSSLDSVDAHLALVAAVPTTAPPGGEFVYNNSAFVILGAVAERVGGAPLHDLAAELVFRPAGLQATSIPRMSRLAPDVAIGHLADGRPHTSFVPERGGGDGGLVTTVGDLDRLWRALRAGDVVPTTVIDEMWTDQRPGDASIGYGLGFWLHRGRPVVRLEGMDAGISMVSCHDLETATTVSIIATTTFGAWPVVRALEEALAP